MSEELAPRSESLLCPRRIDVLENRRTESEMVVTRTEQGDRRALNATRVPIMGEVGIGQLLHGSRPRRGSRNSTAGPGQ